MDYKPSDFFIGVIDLFGILVPGAVLLFLDGDMLLRAMAFQLGPDPATQWAASLVGSYVLGHFLLGIGVPLNKTLEMFRPAGSDPFYKEVRESIGLPGKIEHTRANAFYRAYAYVRLHSPDALADIERQMADYKLFRGLTLVFALDCAFTLAREVVDVRRLLAAGILLVLAALRFWFLLGWTYRITFEYYALLTHPGTAPKQKTSSA
jgi:hypothetical protein